MKLLVVNKRNISRQKSDQIALLMGVFVIRMIFPLPDKDLHEYRL